MTYLVAQGNLIFYTIIWNTDYYSLHNIRTSLQIFYKLMYYLLTVVEIIKKDLISGALTGRLKG